MADDKGGGKTWEPFEIILVILLLVGLLTKLQGEPIAKKTVSSAPPKEVSATPVSPRDTCGLSVITPRAQEKISGALWLSGTTKGCTWQSTESVALYAQVIDAKGKPVSDYTVVPPIAVAGTTTSFAETIVLSGQPLSGKGTLILLPAHPVANEAIAVRIPINF